MRHIIATLALSATALPAQSIRGIIHPMESGRPLAGELITVTDERSRFVAHGSTDLDGRFSIDVQRAGTYRVQWQQRDGRASVEDRALAAGSGMSAGEPVALREGGKVAAYRPFAGVADACRRAAFRDADDAATTEAAMRALLAATALRAADSLVVDVVQFDLERVSGNRTIRVLSVIEGRAAASAVLGVLLPDAAASLESEWKSKLCSASTASLRKDHDAIALTIAPLTGSATASTTALLWIDRKTGAVGGVTPMGADATAPRPEATISLAVLPTGHVVIRGWRLAVPVDTVGGERMRGGALAAISVRGQSRQTLDVPTVRVRLAESSRALRGVSLTLLDGGPITDFDDNGNASIPVGVEGDFMVEVAAPELDALGVSPTVALASARIAAAPSAAGDVVTLPSLPRPAAPTDAPSAERPRASLRVNVIDSSGTRLPGVSIRLADSTGVRIDGRLGNDGSAVFRDLSTEPMVLEARALGFAPSSATIKLVPGENEVRMILNRNLVAQLDPVYIRELPSLLGRHDEFERRKRYGFASATYTEAEIRRRNPVSTWQMFQATAGLKLKRDLAATYATSSRGIVSVHSSNTLGCVMRIAVDGAFLIHPADLNQLPLPSEIYGIEVYAGPSRIPVEYRKVDGSNCGIILIWTK